MNGSSIEEFVSSVDDALNVLNIMVKKMDKKKEKWRHFSIYFCCLLSMKILKTILFLLNRALLESHKQALLNKLGETDDPPLVLHLASLILFQNVTQNMVSASGRFVANILNILEKRLPAEDYQPFQHYHSKFFARRLFALLNIIFFRWLICFICISFTALVLKLFKTSEDDDEYARINEELKENTPLLKQKVACVTKKWLSFFVIIFHTYFLINVFVSQFFSLFDREIKIQLKKKRCPEGSICLCVCARKLVFQVELDWRLYIHL